VVDEIPQQANVIAQTPGKSQTAPDKSRDSLTQGVVEALDIARFAALLANNPMPFLRQHRPISLPIISVDHGTLAVEPRQQIPQPLGALLRAITDIGSNDLSGLDIQCQPHSLPVAFVIHKRP